MVDADDLQAARHSPRHQQAQTPFGRLRKDRHQSGLQVRPRLAGPPCPCRLSRSMRARAANSSAREEAQNRL
jgi:hypothetical protein